MSKESGKHAKAPQASFDDEPLRSNGDPNPKPFDELYELDRKIGEGTYGRVHIARTREKGDEFAVKVIDRSMLSGKDHEVFREVQVLREVSSHPNIVSLVDFFASSTHFNVVLELARGGDLFDSLARRKSYTERDARSVAKDILTAVSYIHSTDFVHRDMKPENLLLADHENGVKVGDFGFARSMSDAPTPAGLVTRCGTLSYAAPEILMCAPYGKPVDVWGCGVVLYILLGGCMPFYGKGQFIMRQITAADFEFNEDRFGPISVEAKQLITRMLALDPKGRITATEALNSSWMAISDSNLSMSSTHLDSTIKGLQKFNAKRKLKAVMHMANIVKKLPFWDSRTLTFMPDNTITSSANSDSKTLESGKIGQHFDDMYSLLSKLQAKDDTTLWKGVAKESGKPFAIKVILRNNSTTDDADVLREVAILHSLRHKHVVKLHDYFEESSRFLLVMESTNGGNVTDRILKNTKYTEKHARELSLALLTAVEYIHSRGVAHRDLKPQNLLLEALNCDSGVKIANFGFARRVHTPLSLTSGFGTPTYVAPEIIKNHPHDESADMWSVGVIMYVLLVGYPPFMEDSRQHLFHKIRQGEYGFQGPAWLSISQQAKDMISSLLVVDPSHRSTAKMALQHQWICDMDDRTLLLTNLAGSQRELRKSLEKTVTPDVSDVASWVASASALI